MTAMENFSNWLVAIAFDEGGARCRPVAAAEIQLQVQAAPSSSEFAVADGQTADHRRRRPDRLG